MAFLDPILRSLVRLHDSLEEVPHAAPKGSLVLIEETTGAAVAAMGPHLFLNHVPLSTSDAADPISPERAWLLPLLKSNSREAACSLDHFRAHIMEIAKYYDAICHEAAAGGASSVALVKVVTRVKRVTQVKVLIFGCFEI